MDLSFLTRYLRLYIMRRIANWATRIGQPLNIAESMRELLERHGFVDVRDDVYKVYCWPFPNNIHTIDFYINLGIG